MPVRGSSRSPQHLAVPTEPKLNRTGGAVADQGPYQQQTKAILPDPRTKNSNATSDLPSRRRRHRRPTKPFPACLSSDAMGGWAVFTSCRLRRRRCRFCGSITPPVLVLAEGGPLVGPELEKLHGDPDRGHREGVPKEALLGRVHVTQGHRDEGLGHAPEAQGERICATSTQAGGGADKLRIKTSKNKNPSTDGAGQSSKIKEARGRRLRLQVGQGRDQQRPTRLRTYICCHTSK